MKREHWRADNEAIERRVNYIMREILAGARHTDIVQECSKNWQISGRQIYNYIRRANTKIRKESERMQKNAFDYHIAIRRDMLKEARDMGLRRIALEIVKDEAKLLGLYAPEKYDISWREEAKEEGMDVHSIYSGIVEEFTAAMVGSDATGSVDGSETESSGDQTPTQSGS